MILVNNKLCALLLVVFLSLPTQIVTSQITLTRDDMPNVGDTIRLSSALSTGSVDHKLTGENHYWDFSSLVPVAQQVDTFVSVSSTPFLYRIVFTASVATIARPEPGVDIIPGYPVTDVFTYFKESDERFQEAGVALTLPGLPLPVKYDEPDVLYTFPVSFGNVDSCHAGVESEFPGLYYLKIDRDRRNFVDGWGTLATPFGTFDVLRLKSEVNETDTVYIDSLNAGYRIPRNYVQYKWIGNDFGVPLLQVDEEGSLLTVTYIDFPRIITSVPGPPVIPEQVRIYPNPAGKVVTLEWENITPGQALIRICDSRGREVYLKEMPLASYGYIRETISLEGLSLDSGVCFICLVVNDLPPVIKKFIYRP